MLGKHSIPLSYVASLLFFFPSFIFWGGGWDRVQEVGRDSFVAQIGLKS